MMSGQNKGVTDAIQNDDVTFVDKKFHPRQEARRLMKNKIAIDLMY